MAPRVVSHTHQEGGPACIHRTVSACDKAHAEWESMQQVILAYRVALGGRARLQFYKGDKTVFGQLVHVIAGEQADIENKDRVPSQSHEVKRLRRAIEQFKAGAIPQGSLYGGLAGLHSLIAAQGGPTT